MKRFLSILMVLSLLVFGVAFADEVSIEAVEEEGQDPVMNLIGDYQDETSQRAVMTIESLGDNVADVTIWWGNSAYETVVWHFTGTVDSGDLSIAYTDCTKNLYTCTDEDDEMVETVEYENGTGKLLCDEETWKLTWVDDMEDAGSGCVFAFEASCDPFSVAGVEIDCTEDELRLAMGEPDAEETTELGKVLTYKDAEIEGYACNATFLVIDDMVRAMFFGTDQGSDEFAGDISLFIIEQSYDADTALGEEKMEEYAEKYCGLTDFTLFTYVDRYATDGTLLMLLRVSDSDMGMLVLDHMLQD